MVTNNVKIRAKEKSGEVTVKILMTHPMETGLRKDKKTGEMVPAHFIDNVICESAGKPLLNSNWNGTVSKNPYLSFKFSGSKGDEFKIAWKDNQGQSGTATKTIK